MIIYREENCRGCQLCVYACPHEIFTMEGGKAVLAHEDRCVECGACELNCEYGAITVTKGTGCLTAIVKEDILKIKPKGCG